jgi:hypothetical protein
MKQKPRVYRHRPQEVVSREDARAHSEAYLQDGIAALGQAFNLTESAELRYCFDSETRREVIELCRQIVTLWGNRQIATRSLANAQDDAAFQRFMARAAEHPPASLPDAE